MQEQAAASVVVTGASTVAALAAGHTFTLEQHADGNGKYLVTGVQHTAELPDLNNSMVSYRNDFTCIPADLVYRPPRTTPRPVVGGMQTAIVIAPLAGPIIDKLGRVKVKFHWDREGTSTTWLRVAQPYSGGPDGLWLPDVNDEVLVGFEHVDPHRPYVIAAVESRRRAARASEHRIRGPNPPVAVVTACEVVLWYKRSV